MSWLLLFLPLALLSEVPTAPCTWTHRTGARIEAECGVVSAAVEPGGDATISVGFARLPATGRKVKADPILLVAGGPGQAATDAFVPALPLLSDWRRERDLILVDMRGTGRSVPLACKDPRPLAEQIAGGDEAEAARLSACAGSAALELRHITSDAAARDLEAVRQALGIEKWNIVGVSYGTRLALVYDRLFPGRARALVLDGVAPVDHAIGSMFAADAHAALNGLEARAPGTRAAYDAVRARWQKSPTVHARHPKTGAPLDVVVDDASLTGAVIGQLYSSDSVAVLPVLLRAAARGDDGPLLAVLLSQRLGQEDGLFPLVNAAVLCAEDIPFIPPAAERGPDTAPFLDGTAAQQALCARVPHATVPAAWKTATTTTTPSLLLSGELDPITPPTRAVRLAESLPDAVHVTVPGHGHNVLFSGCVPEVVHDFIEAGSSRGLDTKCTAKMSPFPIFVDEMGPAP